MTALYRFYDARGVLLYVGITGDPFDRFYHHEMSDWVRDVDPARTRIRWYRTRRAAKAAETRAIKTEHPVHNRQENERPAHPPVQVSLPIRWKFDSREDWQWSRRWFALRYSAEASRFRRGAERRRGALVLRGGDLT